MKVKKMPTPRRSLLVLSVALLAIAVLISFRPEFSGLDRDTLRCFGQTGLLLTYVGALLGLHSLFWDDAFSAARADAKSRITVSQARLELLQDLENSLPPEKFEASRALAKKSLAGAQDDLLTANMQPRIRKVEGWIGVVLIMVGTVAQFVGLG